MASFLSFLLFFLAFFHRPLEVHWTPGRADGGNRSTWLANHLQLIVGDGVEPRDAENLFVEICSGRLLPCCKLSASSSRILL